VAEWKCTLIYLVTVSRRRGVDCTKENEDIFSLLAKPGVGTPFKTVTKWVSFPHPFLKLKTHVKEF
jgi:hypothetical protein